jgi:hypothetical protein
VGDFGAIVDHYEAEMEGLGYSLVPDTFDVTDASETAIDKAFVLLPGIARRSNLAITMVDEELAIQVAFKQPPKGIEAIKRISAARLQIVWHFLQKQNYGPSQAVEWAGSEVLDYDDRILILRLSFVITYPGLIKSANT